MKIIYIAGKYRDARGEYYVVQNIRKAEEAALFVWQNGGVALCPHKNTALFGGACGDDVWLKGDIELLKRCDAIWLIGEWMLSQGALDEEEAAIENGLLLLYNKTDVLEYLKEN